MSEGEQPGRPMRRVELRPPHVRAFLVAAAGRERMLAHELRRLPDRDYAPDVMAAEARADLFEGMAAAADPISMAMPPMVGVSAPESFEGSDGDATPDEVALIELIEARDERVLRFARGEDTPPFRPRVFARSLIAALDAAREARPAGALDLVVLEVLEDHGELSFAEIGQFVHWPSERIEACLNKLRALGAAHEIAGGGRPGPVWQAVEGWRKVEA